MFLFRERDRMARVTLHAAIAQITAAIKKRPNIVQQYRSHPHNYDEKKECRNKQQRNKKSHPWRQGLTTDPNPEHVIVEPTYYSDRFRAILHITS
jgi:hypothetical protein